MDFNEFLLKTAKSKLLNPKYIPTLIAVFGEEGHGKSISKCSEKFLNDQPRQTTDSYLEEIYKFFWGNYPKLVPVYGKGKRKILTDYLVKLYKDGEETNNNNDRPPTTTNQITPDRPQELTPLEFIGRDRPSTPTNQIDSEDKQKFRLIGRDEAITKLDELFKVHKIVLVLGEGGLGKSALAKYYCESKVCEFHQLGNEEIAKAESLVDGWLQGLFGEAPSNQEFRIKLERLRKYLIEDNRGICIVLDNLEPALNDGKFKPEHRCYVDLLKVLSDSRVKSVTLITSRQPIHENVEVFEYKLPELDNKSWCEYFRLHKIEVGENPSEDVNSALNQMRRDYGGNAEFMYVLSGAIANAREHKLDLEAYWERNKEDLRAHPKIEGFIKWQFDVLENENPLAYKLLCRMGCYRYQDAVSTVPEKGLLDLLWGEATIKARRVVDNLFNRCLIKFSDKYRGYFLHPVMREEAVSRLKDEHDEWTEEGEESNRKAAGFWTNSIRIIINNEDARKAFEAYYHYFCIDDFQSAGEIIAYNRYLNEFDVDEPLGAAFYRLGLLSLAQLSIISVVNIIKPSYTLARLYNILGDCNWMLGEIHEAIKCHKASEDISKRFLDIIEDKNYVNEIFQFQRLELVSFFNRGLCYMDLREFDESILFFEKCISLAHQYSILSHTLEGLYCIAFLRSHSLKDQEQVLQLLQKYWDKALEITWSSWGRCYSYIFSAFAYSNLNEIQKSFEMFECATVYAEKCNYPQVRARAFIGLSEIYRSQQDFDKAYSHHEESIELLDRIGAKCDLAEAYFQLGLTYKIDGKHDQAEECKAEALKLFEAIKAPKQCDRVNKAFGGNIQ